MKCRTCGTTLSAGALLCGECGTSAIAPRPTLGDTARYDRKALLDTILREQRRAAAARQSAAVAPASGRAAPAAVAHQGSDAPTIAIPTQGRSPEHAPALHEPAEHEPALHEPALHESAQHEPAEHEPTVHEPTVHEPAEHEPAQRESAEPQPADFSPLIPATDSPAAAAAALAAESAAAEAVTDRSAPPTLAPSAPLTTPDPQQPRHAAPDTGADPGAHPATARPLYSLVFSTGESVRVSGSGLVGRNPTPLPGEHVDYLVQIVDPARSVSKTHLVFGLENGEFWVADRGSSNGTRLGLDLVDPVELTPGERIRIPRGTRVGIADQYFDLH